MMERPKVAPAATHLWRPVVVEDPQKDDDVITRNRTSQLLPVSPSGVSMSLPIAGIEDKGNDSGPNVLSGSLVSSTPPFTFGANNTKPAKQLRKPKVKPRVVPMDVSETYSKGPDSTYVFALGDKRKILDSMFVNDDMVDEVLLVKKPKLDSSLAPGSGVLTVEAVVGESQPRPAL